MGVRMFHAAVLSWLVLFAGACGDSRPDGDCLTDFDCELDQLCGLAGRCLLCANCERGRIGTCTAPAYPLDRSPDTIRLEGDGGDELLIYVYRCPQGTSEFGYSRAAGEACFDPRPSVADGCDLT